MSDSKNIDLYISILRQKKLLSISQLEDLLKKASEVLMEEPNVVRVPAPVTVIGDIHGQFYDMMELFKVTGEPPDSNLLFLGDYVDRGYDSIECLCFILALKVRFRRRITMLRGNHESCDINKIYGFYDECFKKYNTEKVWKLFTGVFQCLPLSAIVENKVFCLHGGLSPAIKTIDNLSGLRRFSDVPHEGAMCDLLWSDPDDNTKGFSPSPRSAGYVFGPDVTEEFLHKNKLSMIARAHQLTRGGFIKAHKNSVVTVFSAPNYCYRCGNLAAVMDIDEHFNINYTTFENAKETPDPKVTFKCPEYFL